MNESETSKEIFKLDDFVEDTPTFTEFKAKVLREVDELFDGKSVISIAESIKGLGFSKRGEESKLARAELGLPPKREIPLELGLCAYGFQINDYCTPKQSLELAAKEHNEDIDWLESVKHDKWRHNQHVVDVAYEDYFNSVVDVDKVLMKDMVKNSTTLNSGLTNLHRFQKMEMSIKDMKKRLAALEAAQANTRLDVDNILAVTECDVMEPKVKAKLMKEKGVKVEAIAKELKVHRKTIQRWLKAKA